MLAPFATLVFLATLWLIARLVLEIVAESGGRIAAALLGRPVRETRTVEARVRFSRPRIAARPVRAEPKRWRAAA